MGKTVISLSLIGTSEPTRPRGSSAPQGFTLAHKNATHLGGTLVIVPVGLLMQWKREIADKTALTCHVYYGEQGCSATAVQLATYGIVLTTLTKVMELARGGIRRPAALERVSWQRVVVDECQFVRSDTSVTARAVAGLDCTHIWMLSGTPLATKLDDLQGELSLLRIW